MRETSQVIANLFIMGMGCEVPRGALGAWGRGQIGHALKRAVLPRMCNS